MKRRTLKHFRPQKQPVHHHHVYVVLLDPMVSRIQKVRARNPNRDPKKPCVDAKDAQRIRTAQQTCFVNFVNQINKLSLDPEEKKSLIKDLRRDGCGFNFTSPKFLHSFLELEKLRAEWLQFRTNVMSQVATQLKTLDQK